MKYKHLLSAIIFILFSNVGFAQNEFSSDRPGFANGSFITPQKMLGFESGFQFSSGNNFTQVDVGQLLLRQGINTNLELRLALNSISFRSVDQPGNISNLNQNGFQDISVGAKYNLIAGNEDKANVSILGQLNFPVGSDAFSSQKAIPTFSLLTDYGVSEKMAITGNLGYSFQNDFVDDVVTLILTPTFSVSEDGSVNVFLDYAGFYSGNGNNQHFLEGGITKKSNSGTQLDLNFGYDLESEFLFAGLGFAKAF